MTLINRRNFIEGSAAASLLPASTRAVAAESTVKPILGGFTAPHFGTRSDIEAITDPEIRRTQLIEAAREDAAAAYLHGGRLLRVFYSARGLDPDLTPAMDLTRFREGTNPEVLAILLKVIKNPNKPVFMDSLEDRLWSLDNLDRLLDKVLLNLPNGKGPSGRLLNFEPIDCYMMGIDGFNQGLKKGQDPIKVFLSLVQHAPIDILETPDAALLGYFNRHYRFDTLWDKYARANIILTRLLARRYATNADEWRGQPKTAVVIGFEHINEPDYNWIPDEVRIEEAVDPAINPMNKYITELHLQEIPDVNDPVVPFEKTDWGFQRQSGSWPSSTSTASPILEFDWGAKFNWYVKAAAEIIRHMSFAVKAEGSSAGVDVKTICGGVTHSNIDFLARMYRQNDEVFRWIDAVAVHPYHWPDHNIWDKNFVADVDRSDWRKASPHAFAKDYVKHFDFIREVSKLTKNSDPAQSFGLFGKRIWVTEFGISTKKLGTANMPLAKYVKFIKQRNEAPIPGGYPSVDWEDIWDAFLSQVDKKFLADNNVDVFILYALRELDKTFFDLNDQDRSNFALFRKDGSARMEASTAIKLDRFLHSLSD